MKNLPTHTQALFVDPPPVRLLRNKNSLRFALALEVQKAILYKTTEINLL